MDVRYAHGKFCGQTDRAPAKCQILVIVYDDSRKCLYIADRHNPLHIVIFKLSHHKLKRKLQETKNVALKLWKQVIIAKKKKNHTK